MSAGASWRRVLGLAVALFLLGATLEVAAVKHRRPFHPAISLGYGYDNNGAAAGCLNYACGTNNKCYHTHTGSDFPLPNGTDVLAGAGGVIEVVSTGCANFGYRGNPCGGRCGNYVRMRHSDGTRTIYCHMQSGGMTVSVNQTVSCGQKLGRSASSGSSTGYHLHFGWTAGSTRDPFTGGCAAGGGWVNQGSFNGVIGTGCEVTCQCTPGQQQNRGCGRCGTQRRTCNSGCQWGGWGGCTGQGPCSPNAAQTRACCDCGSQRRTCSNGCAWRAWSACNGPDPAGSPGCDTGADGDCAAGTIKCTAGCLTCTQTSSPMAERCDGRDNDCDGVLDNDATEVGDPPPPYAAALVDLSMPSALAPGQIGTVWARFKNVGTERWPSGATWIASASEDGPVSSLWVEDGWSAFDAPHVVAEDVAPGATTTVTFPVAMPSSGGVSPAPTEFRVMVEGVAVQCPTPSFTVSPVRLSGGAVGPTDEADTTDTGSDGIDDDTAAPAPPDTQEAASDVDQDGSSDTTADPAEAEVNTPSGRDSGCAGGGELPPLFWLLFGGSVAITLRPRRRQA